jgi:hypothetical protein
MKKADAPTLGSLLESFFRRRLVAQRRASPATIATYRGTLRPRSTLDPDRKRGRRRTSASTTCTRPVSRPREPLLAG